MGWIKPALPEFDRAEWRARSHHERLRPLVVDWATGGFGTPYAVYLLYVIKLVVFVIGAGLVIATTPGVSSIAHVGDWWTMPVVYEKFAVWTLLWEILGLGCGSMPLTFRFIPPIGGLLYWLQPGTVRLAPWPDKVPLTSGTRRSIVDVYLYAGILAAGAVLLASDPVLTGSHAGSLQVWKVLILLGLLGVMGLRDKAIFLASRPEQYATVLIVFCFPTDSLLFGLKLIMLAIWWGAATSKLNKHFPFVVSVMISNSPLQRFNFIKRRLWTSYPEDCRPSFISASAAHVGTVVEYGVPLVLLFARGGIVTTIAVTIMVIFHIHITSTFPLGVPLEWNLFVIYSLLFLYGHYASAGFSDFHSIWLGIILAVLLIGVPVLGNMRPDLVSFLPSMRYYAGNWGTSVWLFRKTGDADDVISSTEDQLDVGIRKPAAIVPRQLLKLYDEPTVEIMLYKGLAFRAMHSHGRALSGLLPRAVADLDDYRIREGELIAGVVLGWNFGDGHLHNTQLVEAIQERCHYASGDVRVVMLEAQPFGKPRQEYRIVDAHDGLIERGYVQVSDMVTRQPWLDADGTIPVSVLEGGIAEVLV